ncbi:MAG: peptidoglycan-binding protein [bacterium]|nr:peptidoglycan-binding protein [bacterium]
MALLKKGRKGAPVRILQEALGVTADGDFGSGTQKALKEWQSDNGLTADGIAGPDTFAALGLFQLVLVRKGSRGSTVKKLQNMLGLDADGKFGPGTEKAVKAWQSDNGIEADGMVGVKTLAAMGLFGDNITNDHVAAVDEPVAEEGEEAETVKVANAGTGGMSLWKSITSLFD